MKLELKKVNRELLQFSKFCEATMESSRIQVGPVV